MLEAFNVSMAQVGLAAVMVFAAFVVRGMAGFGTGIIAIPLLVFVMPIYTAAPMM